MAQGKPDPNWGLHLVDADIAMGDLVDVVGKAGGGVESGAPVARTELKSMGPRRVRRRGFLISTRGMVSATAPIRLSTLTAL